MTELFAVFNYSDRVQRVESKMVKPGGISSGQQQQFLRFTKRVLEHRRFGFSLSRSNRSNKLITYHFGVNNSDLY